VTHDVQEAVALADRVVSLAEGRIASNVAIELPRPRQRQSAAFNGHVAAILAGLSALAARDAASDSHRPSPAERDGASSDAPREPYRGWVQTWSWTTIGFSIRALSQKSVCDLLLALHDFYRQGFGPVIIDTSSPDSEGLRLLKDCSRARPLGASWQHPDARPNVESGCDVAPFRASFIGRAW
jgi:energy-coupling factor transporter ATP-binding protein EcfA2